MGIVQDSVLCYIIFSVLILTVAAHTHSDHTKYPECQPREEYAIHARRKDIPDGDLKYYHIMEKNNGKYKYYICRSCSLCGDGIDVIAPCWNSQDTKCGGCIDPTHMYDHVTKSCQPKERILGYRDDPIEIHTTQDLTTPKLYESTKGEEVAVDYIEDDEVIKSQPLEVGKYRHNMVYISVVVFFAIAILLIIGAMIMYVRRQCKKKPVSLSADSTSTSPISEV